MRGGGEVDQRSTGFLDGPHPSGPALTVPPPQFFVGGFDRPNESRAFVHKRILGAAKSFVTSGFNPLSAISGFIPTPRRAAPPRLPPGPRASRFFEEAGRFPAGRGSLPRPIPRRPIPSFAPLRAPRPVTRIREAATAGIPSAPARPVTRIAAVAPTSFAAPAPAPRTGGCGPGFVMRGGKCVRKGGILSATQRFFGFGRPPPRAPPEVTTMARSRTGQAVVGAFGMPAMVPVEEVRRLLVCPRGMVLGTDDLCYPKGVLSSRNLHRKWRRPPRAPVTAADARAIRKAAATRDRVLQLAKDVGLHASKTRPAKQVKAAPHQHLLAAPAQHIRVISEETN